MSFVIYSLPAFLSFLFADLLTAHAWGQGGAHPQLRPDHVVHLLCLLFSDDDDCVECEVVLEALEEIDDEADIFGKSLNYCTF